MKRGDVPILKHTISELTPSDLTARSVYYEFVDEALAHLLKTKPRGEHFEEVLVLLRGLTAILGDSPRYFLTVARSEDERAWDLFKGSFRKMTSDEQGYIVYNLARGGHGRAIEFLIKQEGKSLVKAVNWRQLLLDNVTTLDNSSKPDTVRVALPYVNVATKTNEILKRAAGGSVEVFKLVLADERVDIMNDVEGTLLAILESSTSVHPGPKALTARRKTIKSDLQAYLYDATDEDKQLWNSKTLALTRTPRFDLAKITTKEITLILACLTDSYSRVRKYNQVRAWMKGQWRTPDQLLYEEPTTSIHMIERAVSLCGLNTPLLLAEWMLKSGENDIYLAAHSVIHKYVPSSRDVRMVRVVLLTIMRDNLSFDALIDQFLVEGMTLADIGLSISLAAATIAEEDVFKARMVGHRHDK